MKKILTIFAFFAALSMLVSSVNAQGATATPRPTMGSFSRVYTGVPVCPNGGVPTNNVVLVHLYSATSGATSTFPTQSWTFKGTGKGPISFGTTSPSVWGTGSVQFPNVADHLRMYDSVTGTVFQPTGSVPHSGFNYLDHWSLGGWVAQARLSTGANYTPVPAGGPYTVQFAVPANLCSTPGINFSMGISPTGNLVTGQQMTIRTIFTTVNQPFTTQNPMPASIFIKNGTSTYTVSTNYNLYQGDRSGTITIPATVPPGSGYYIEIMGNQLVRQGANMVRPSLR